jgi:hypothetical protein
MSIPIATGLNSDTTSFHIHDYPNTPGIEKKVGKQVNVKAVLHKCTTEDCGEGGKVHHLHFHVQDVTGLGTPSTNNNPSKDHLTDTLNAFDNDMKSHVTHSL